MRGQVLRRARNCVLVILLAAGAALAHTTAAQAASVQSTGGWYEVLVDANTGSVLSARTGTNISNHNICNSGEGCYLSGQIPLANQGFFGTPGTFFGNWPSRSGFLTGNHVAAACWVNACSPAFGPNTRVTFSVLVTGTSFTLFS